MLQWAVSAARVRSAGCGESLRRRCPGSPSVSPPRSHLSGSDADLRHTNTIRLFLESPSGIILQITVMTNSPCAPSSQWGFNTWASTACLMVTGPPTSDSNHLQDPYNRKPGEEKLGLKDNPLCPVWNEAWRWTMNCVETDLDLWPITSNIYNRHHILDIIPVTEKSRYWTSVSAHPRAHASVPVRLKPELYRASCDTAMVHVLVLFWFSLFPSFFVHLPLTLIHTHLATPLLRYTHTHTLSQLRHLQLQISPSSLDHPRLHSFCDIYGLPFVRVVVSCSCYASMLPPPLPL